jgi:glycosyltransferase involved in cell wall biosynthesis
MHARPRIVFLTDIVTPYMAAVLAELARRVDLTALFCSRTGTRGAGWALAEPLPFRHRVLGGLAIRRRKVDGADLYPTPRILRALFAERPAVVISGAFSFPTLYAATYGRLTAGRLIIHSDGTSGSERNLGRLQLLARDRLLGEASACVGNSEPAVERFIELGADPARVFRAPHSTNIAPFHAVARQRFATTSPRDRVTVLHVGRLIPRKGIDRLLPAVAAASADVPLRLVIVGSGPEEGRLRGLTHELGIEGMTEFVAFVDQPGLPAVYAAADIFAMPTRDDPFGMVLLEAAASGLPLLASPFAGASRDLVEEGRSGFVADPADTAAWSDALRALALDTNLRRRLGSRAHELTLARTPERAADGYAEAVDAVLSLPRGTRRAGPSRRGDVLPTR